jgi:hypothetical protein
MTAFIFIGDPRDPHDMAMHLDAYGLRFPRNQPVEVTDEKIARKLSGNSHFRAANGATPAAQAEPFRGADPRDAEIAALKGRVADLEAQLAEAHALLAEAGPAASAPEPDWRTFSKEGLVAWAATKLDLKLDGRMKLETLQQQVADYLDGQDASAA